MMETAITWYLIVSKQGGPSDKDRAQLEAHFDQMMTELVKLEACMPEIHTPGIAADFTSYPHVRVEVEMTVDGADEAALKVGNSVLRTAIHAAGGSTPNWPGTLPEPVARYEQERVELERA